MAAAYTHTHTHTNHTHTHVSAKSASTGVTVLCFLFRLDREVRSECKVTLLRFLAVLSGIGPYASDEQTKQKTKVAMELSLIHI